ncbi:MAG TPA: hypothetical protein VML01_00455 [Bryobacterales bacterium]|nr:hypothetical protein [Bryobacterales bacterium]
MKIVRVETLLECGAFTASREWREAREALHLAIRHVVWPIGSNKFTIYPQSGKKRGEGNGVKPIKNGLMCQLKELGWDLEVPLEISSVKRPGNLDAVLHTLYGPVAVEWETGNISSSHRALNKMALGLLKGKLACGTLIVPSRKLYKFLTDRVGNFDELEPYLDLWRAVPCEQGVLEIIEVEHDAESLEAPRIPKGTDGRALR